MKDVELSQRKKIKYLMIFIPAIVLILLPIILPSPYFLHMMILILMFISLNQSWNILSGYAGQISLHHAMFFGTGMYTAVLANKYLNIDTLLGMFLAMIPAIAIALVLGVSCFHLRGPYFALATLAFGEVLRLVAGVWVDFTGGRIGTVIPPRPPIHIMGITINFIERPPNYYIILVLTIFICFATWRLVNSGFGLKIRSIRDNEDAARSLGVNAFRLKLEAAIISAAFAGLIGGFYGHYLMYVEPEAAYDPLLSLQMMLGAIIGGAGTVIGPIIGAPIVIGAAEYVRVTFGFVAGYDLLVFGVLLMAVVLLMPYGIVKVITGEYRPVLIIRKSKESYG